MAYFYIILKLVSVIESMRFYKIPAGSLIPTIMAGDWIVTLKVWSTENLKRRDMIVFPFPPDPTIDYIKRVIGLPGETLEISIDRVFIIWANLLNIYSYLDSPPDSNNFPNPALTGTVRMARAVKSPAIFSSVLLEVVADIIILAARNSQVK